MNIKLLPGTNIEVDYNKDEIARAIIEPMFLSGGLVLSQVCGVTGLEPHMVQNWVKRGFVSPPINKKYTIRQFSRILIINFLKDSLQIDKITKLISYINGKLFDESDDIIDDSELYFYFVDIASKITLNINDVNTVIYEKLSDYKETHNGDKDKLFNVLKSMILLYLSGRLKNMADIMLINNFEGEFE